MKEGWQAECWSQLIWCPDNKLKLQQPVKAEQRDGRETQRSGNGFIPSIHSVQITVFVWHIEKTACCLYEFITAERSFSCRAPLKSGSHITVKQLHLVFKTTLHIFMKPQPSCTCRCLFRSFKRAAGVHQILQRACRRGEEERGGRGEEGGRWNPTSVTQE